MLDARRWLVKALVWLVDPDLLGGVKYLYKIKGGE